MKYARLLLIFAVLLTSGHATLSAASSADEAEAKAVLLRYFDALTQGDTLTLRSLLGGDLLEKRSRLLNNPAYPVFLVETYGSARFSIEQIETINPSDIAINASIIFDQVSTARRRFLLRKEQLTPSAGENYRIYREDSPDTP